VRCEDVYYKTYNKAPEGVLFCPYRVSPLGAHIDHQLGIVNGFAIDKGIHIAYGTKHNGVVELQSLNFPKRAQFHVLSIPDNKAGDWADYLRGAAKKLGEKYPLRHGISAVIEGSLPIGGLSSSAAVTIAFLCALARVNSVVLDEWEIILMAKAAENEYVGVNCGKLDQCCEVLSKKDHLLYLDCQDDLYDLIPKPDNMRPFKIAVFFSGLDRTLVNSAYNLRQDECKAAAYSLMAFSGMEYGKFKESRLRYVPKPVFEEYKEKIPLPFRKRANHYFSEMERVKKGLECWNNADLENYGKLIFESGRSSIENYECGCDELISLYNIMCETDGIFGGRFSGAGFKGCCMALIDPEKSEEIQKRIESEYLKLYPSLEGKYSSCVCDLSNGVMS
jgi:galactokinase/galacturonokinase